MTDVTLDDKSRPQVAAINDGVVHSALQTKNAAEMTLSLEKHVF